MKRDNKRVQAAIAKYGSEEAYRAEMRRRYLKSRENYDPTRGGFAALKANDPAKLKEIAIKGAQKRWEKTSE